MAYPNRGFLALALSLLFLLSGPLSQFSLPESPIVELESNEVFSTGSSEFSEVTISSPGGAGIGPLIEMDATHALQKISFLERERQMLKMLQFLYLLFLFLHSL